MKKCELTRTFDALGSVDGVHAFSFSRVSNTPNAVFRGVGSRGSNFLEGGNIKGVEESWIVGTWQISGHTILSIAINAKAISNVRYPALPRSPSSSPLTHPGYTEIPKGRSFVISVMYGCL